MARYSELAQSEPGREEPGSSIDDRVYRDLRALQRTVFILRAGLCTFAGLFMYWKPTPVPEFPLEIVSWEEDARFANWSHPGAGAAWASISPKGDGFILVDEPEQYMLEPGKQTKSGPMYDVTVFHQLHCLKHIRNYLYTIVESAQRKGDSDRLKQFLAVPDKHAAHCFDYIRQGLMCNADMTLEWPRTEANGERFAVDGWNIPHQCKDWGSIMEFMESRRFKYAWEKQSDEP